MPVNPSLYPDNWQDLATKVKEAADWRCQCCGKRCYKPGEIPFGLTRSEWSGAILQTHHRDFNCSNNSLSNLTSLCSVCHLNIHRSRYSSVSPGQLSLW